MACLDSSQHPLRRRKISSGTKDCGEVLPSEPWVSSLSVYSSSEGRALHLLVALLEDLKRGRSVAANLVYDEPGLSADYRPVDRRRAKAPGGPSPRQGEKWLFDIVARSALALVVTFE